MVRRLLIASWLLGASAIPAWGQVPRAAVQGPAVPAQTPRVASIPQPHPAQGAMAPEWVPLPADHQKYLDDILAYWESSTDKIQEYRCEFKRWEYEPDLKTYAEGVIKYASPDKGLFKVEKMRHRTPPAQAGGEPQWAEQQEGFREHWVCDGTSIFEFDYQNKQLKQRPLPPEMRNEKIVEGPLPFMFGAKAAQIKQRFWLRVITPRDAKKEYWLEAIPKTQEDAASFRKLHIIIDEEDFLPKGMAMFHRNQAQTTFAFEKRETNWSGLGQRLNPLHRDFFEPATPSGWKKVAVP